MAPVSSLVGPLAQEALTRDGNSPVPRLQQSTVDFSNVLEEMVASANQSARYSRGAKQAFASGARDDIHGTMIAMSKADIELRLVSNVRNKIIDAFYELWRMQI